MQVSVFVSDEVLERQKSLSTYPKLQKYLAEVQARQQLNAHLGSVC